MADLVLYDRSRVVADWSCPRKRYWNYEYNGRGIAPTTTSLELYMGQAVHDGLAAIAHIQKDGLSKTIDDIEVVATQQMMQALAPHTAGEVDDLYFANEQATLVAGLLRGFHQYMWPKIMDQYPEVVAIEEEMHYDHDGLRFMSKPDLVLRDKEGNLWGLEYKTTSSKKDGWINSWDTAIQLHSSIKAIEATLGEKPVGVIIQGLYKGYETGGKQSSPLCYSYCKQGTPPFGTTTYRYDYAYGYKKYPVWQMPGGLKQWVQSMPQQMLAEQFPTTAPIFVKEDMIDSFFEQRKYREHEINLAKQMLAIADEESSRGILDTAFPQKFDTCQPAWGHPCPYKRICHGHVLDPLASGWTLREAHHLEEAQKLDGKS